MNFLNFYPPGALKSFITSDRGAPLPPYISPAEKETRNRIFAFRYRALSNWYRAPSNNIGQDEDIQEGVDRRTRCPVLVITESPSIATIPGFENSTRQFADDFRVKKVSTKGHWVQLEANDEINMVLEDFFEALATPN
ncbi:hypothetical protein MMC22_000510 [Lobaria immixta]|nr:hypothetical protein [Lobaria immixta]